MAANSMCISRASASCLLPLWKALQDQQVCLTHNPFRLLPLHWVLKQVRFYKHPLRVESLFPRDPQLSSVQALLALSARHYGGLSSQYKILFQGNPLWGLDPSLLWEDLSSCDHPPICGLPL